jgi:hypothetical protein
MGKCSRIYVLYVVGYKNENDRWKSRQIIQDNICIPFKLSFYFKSQLLCVKRFREHSSHVTLGSCHLQGDDTYFTRLEFFNYQVDPYLRSTLLGICPPVQIMYTCMNVCGVYPLTPWVDPKGIWPI